MAHTTLSNNIVIGFSHAMFQRILSSANRPMQVEVSLMDNQHLHYSELRLQVSLLKRQATTNL